MQELLPYVNNAGVFGCPASNIVPSSLMELQWEFAGWLSYGWNATLFGYQVDFLVKTANIIRPTRTVFLCDTVGYNLVSLASPNPGSSTGYQYAGIYWSYPSQNTPETYNGDTKIIPPNALRPSARHNGLVNVAFCDGHAGSFTEQELLKVQQGPGSHIAYLASEDKGYGMSRAGRQ